MVAVRKQANGGSGHLNLLKLCVGIDDVPHLARVQAERRKQRKARGEPAESRHLTRQVPRRAEEIVAGGSIYWIIKGFVRVRQRIVRIDLLDPPVETKRCALVLAPQLIRTELQARRPHQGWRYLEIRDAPADLTTGRDGGEDLPPEFAAELRSLGLL